MYGNFVEEYDPTTADSYRKIIEVDGEKCQVRCVLPYSPCLVFVLCQFLIFVIPIMFDAARYPRHCWTRRVYARQLLSARRGLLNCRPSSLYSSGVNRDFCACTPSLCETRLSQPIAFTTIFCK